MKVLIGALALAVICALFALPAAVMLGWAPISALAHQTDSRSGKGRAA